MTPTSLLFVAVYMSPNLWSNFSGNFIRPQVTVNRTPEVFICWTIHGETSRLEKLAKAGSSKVVRKTGKSRGRVGETEIGCQYYTVLLLYNVTSILKIYLFFCYLGVIQCVILQLFIKLWILKAPARDLFLINVKQQLSTIAFNCSMSMNYFLPYWKSQGVSWNREG